MARELSAVTLENINKAATELVAEKGIDQLNIRSVCARAGIAVGTFYNYYENKADLLLGRVFSMDEYLQKNIFCTLSEEPKKDLLAVFQGYGEYVMYNGADCCLEFFSFIYKTKADKDEFTTRPLYAKTLEIINKGIEQNIFTDKITPETIAIMSVAFIRNVCAEWCRRGGSYSLADSIDQQFGLWVKGISR